MGLKIIPAEGGGYRPTWYARFTRNGQKVNVSLGVAIRGNPPVTVGEDGERRFDLGKRGDDAFEISRAKATAALARMHAAAKTTGDTQAVQNAKTADIQRRYYRARTGKSIKGVRLLDLPELWAAQKRSYTPTENWKNAVGTWFKRFAAFAARHASAHGARCEYVNEITDEIATAWFDEIKAAFTWESVCKQMSLMRNAYARYATNGKINPFSGIITRNRETANARKPHKSLTGGELERLFDCAREDKDTFALLVCAACTGMRAGDCCNLKWADVDLKSGLINCVTRKVGVTVWVPIFGRLREVLEERAALPSDGERPSPFVFPKLASQYASNPTAIYRNAKPYFAMAAFDDADEAEKPAEVDADGNALPPPELEAVIDGAKFSVAKRARLLEVNRRFRAGEQSKAIAAALASSRSAISMDLREIEKLTGEKLRPRAAAAAKRKTTLDLIEKTRERRKVGKRAASVLGLHSLRGSFALLAVESGVPLADVARIVGHTSVETTSEFYFNPGAQHAQRVREQMRGTVLDGDAPAAIATPDQSAVAPSLDSFIAGLSDGQRKELARKLLGL